MSFLSAVADVFDKLAEEIDSRPSVVEKVAAPVVTEDPLKAITATLQKVAGSSKSISAETARRVAEDKTLNEILSKVAAERDVCTPMGGPSNDIAVAVPETKKEKLANAFDAWGNSIIRHG